MEHGTRDASEHDRREIRDRHEDRTYGRDRRRRAGRRTRRAADTAHAGAAIHRHRDGRRDEREKHRQNDQAPHAHLMGIITEPYNLCKASGCESLTGSGPVLLHADPSVKL